MKCIASRIASHGLRSTLKAYLQPLLLKSQVAPQSNISGNSIKSHFTTIYEENLFLGEASRSGEGSNLAQTAVIRDIIPEILSDLRVEVILDGPCGDWHWMQHVNLAGVKYIGVDIVEDLIKQNISNFSSANVSFYCLNLIEDMLPRADISLNRDCFVHLSFADIHSVLRNLKAAGIQYLLTTTFVNRTKNIDLGDTFWRPLNLQIAPFNFPEPLRLINEGCTEADGSFDDKCLGLWRIADLNV